MLAEEEEVGLPDLGLFRRGACLGVDGLLQLVEIPGSGLRRQGRLGFGLRLGQRFRRWRRWRVGGSLRLRLGGGHFAGLAFGGGDLRRTRFELLLASCELSRLNRNCTLPSGNALHTLIEDTLPLPQTTFLSARGNHRSRTARQQEHACRAEQQPDERTGERVASEMAIWPARH